MGIDSITENSFNQSSTKRNLRILYYSFLVVLHLHVDHISRSLYKNLTLLQHFSFNTNMSFFFNLFYFSYVLLIHLPFGNKLKNSKFLESLSKFNFSVSFVVFSIYWGMVAIDPSLILQDHANRILPFKYDLFLHGGNFLLNLIEHLYVFPKTDAKSIGFTILTFFYVAYLIYLKVLFHYYNVVIYPFIGVLELSQVFILLISAVILVNTGRFIYSLLAKKECAK